MSNKMGLVLSGGSVRAAAQIGVLKALEEYCLEPDVVVGTSGGSIVASLYAGGLSAQQLEQLFLEYSRSKGEFVDLNWGGAILALLTWDIKRLSGAVRGDGLEQIILNSLPVNSFQKLTKCDLLIPAVNLNNGQQTVFCDPDKLGLSLTDGEYADYPIRSDLTIAQAVRASISIPGIFVPAVFGDPHVHCYVDGGLRDGYPLNIAVRLGKAEQIIGVNLGYAGMRRDAVLAEGPVEILSQSLDIMMRAQYEDRLADQALSRSRIMTLNPLIYDVGTFEVQYIPEMISRGYTVATKLFREWDLKAGDRRNAQFFFSKFRGFRDFPAKNTAYFQELLENQIKKPLRALPQSKRGWSAWLRGEEV